MKNKKKTLCVIVCLCCLLGTVLGAQNRVFTAQEADVSVAIDEEPAVFEAPMLLLQGHTYVPLRELCEKLDVLVEWNPNTRAINLETKKDSAAEVKDWADHGTLKDGLRYLHIDDTTYSLEEEIELYHMELMSTDDQPRPNGAPTARAAAEIWAEENSGYAGSSINQNMFFLWIDFDKKLDCWVISQCFTEKGIIVDWATDFVVDRKTGRIKRYRS